MRIATVIGTVTLNRAHPNLRGGSYRVVVPQSLANLTGANTDIAEELVCYDEFGAGLGSSIAISEGAEAAQPFFPEVKPIDAYNSAILDRVEVAPLETFIK